MKPEYKKLYKDIVSRKINSESINKNIERPAFKYKILGETNVFEISYASSDLSSP